MLVDLKTFYTDVTTQMLASCSDEHKNDPCLVKVVDGVYFINQFNFDNLVEPLFQLNGDYDIPSPMNLSKDPDQLFGALGVCDNYQQVLDQSIIQSDPNRKFIMGLVQVSKDKQASQGGWRWHKWGQYIGEQVPECEYLADEPNIERVYVYMIIELTDSLLELDAVIRQEAATPGMCELEDVIDVEGNVISDIDDLDTPIIINRG